MSINPKSPQGIFSQLAELTPEERAPILEQECGDDPALLRRVQALLLAHDAPDSFLDRKGPEFEGTYIPESDSFGGYRLELEPGAEIADRYTLREMIGEGGMGEVWVAKQSEPVKRRVALKLIKAGMDSKAVLQRFEQERQALALMDHPNIARVYDAGVMSTGQPFFVMELVNGLPLDKFCDEAQLGIRERLELFIPICQAVQHAHQKGIVHRDLKPANVLITMIDGKPVPKVIDFGVAKAFGTKLTDETMTQFGMVVGTLAYMSPEQAAFSGDDVDTRTDIYSLGVMLYELLTGLRPIDQARLQKAALTEMIRIIREEEPSKPSTRLSTNESLPSLAAMRKTDPKRLTSMLRGELDWVVMKCLEKPRDRRYDTANALSRDIQRYLADEVVEARPPSAMYRVQKVFKRNKGAAIAASLLLLTLVIGITGTTYGMLEARKQTDLAKAETKLKEVALTKEAQRAEGERRARQDEATARQEAVNTAEELEYQLGIMHQSLAEAAIDNHDPALALERLDRVSPEQRGWAWHYRRKLAVGGIYTINAGTNYSVAYHPDGTKFATCDGASIKEWDAQSGTFLRELKFEKSAEYESYSLVISYSQDGHKILRGGGLMNPKVWDTRTGEIVLELDEPKCLRAVFNREGSRILTAPESGRLKVWDASDGKLLLSVDGVQWEEFGPTFNFTTDDERILGAYNSGLALWNAKQEGPPLAEWKLLKGYVNCVSCSPDGTKVIIGFNEGNAQVLDANNGTTLFTLKHLVTAASRIADVTFSPDGKRIVTVGGSDQVGVVKVWDAETGAELLDLIGHQASVDCVVFSPDGTRMITGSQDNTVKVWDARLGTPWIELKGKENGFAVNDIAFSPDSTQIITGSGLQSSPTSISARPSDKKNGPVSVQVWDARTGQTSFELSGLTGVVESVTFSPDGEQILTGGWVDVTDGVQHNHIVRKGHVTFWNAKNGKKGKQLEGLQSGINCAAFSPNGEYLATAGVVNFEGLLTTLVELKIWDPASGKTVLDLTPLQEKMPGFQPGERGGILEFSPDGTRIVVGGLRKRSEQGFGAALDIPKIYDVRSGKLLFEIELEQRFKAISSAAFSPDGTKILISNGNEARVWDVSSDQPTLLITLEGHTAVVNKAVFSPTGDEIATASADGSIRVWDVRTGTALYVLNGNIGDLRSVAFSPNGRRLAAGSGGNDQMVKAIIWEVPTIE